MRRANDPQRREKIIQATLEAVKLYGIHAVTHRKIATLAGVPLGSMTYYFQELMSCYWRRSAVLLRSCPGNIRHFLAMLVMLRAHARLSPI